MGGGPSRVTQAQAPTLPPGAAQLVQTGADQTQVGLGMSPITNYLSPNPQNIVGPDQATMDALAYFRTLAGGGATPGVLDAFNRLQLPLIQQQAMQAGLGRSGAEVDAAAMGQASSLMQALGLQSQGATAEGALGDYLRQITQQQADAPFQDYLRRQGITESLLSGATGLIPSSIGQMGTQTNKNQGLIGWLFGTGPGGKGFVPLIPVLGLLFGGLLA